MGECERELLQRIEALRPGSLVFVGDGAEHLFDDFRKRHSQCVLHAVGGAQALDELASLARCEVGVVLELASHERDEAGQLIARLRDVLCERIFVVVTVGGIAQRTAWDCRELMAFGLKRLGSYEEEKKYLYGYDVGNYRSAPDWLNAKHWANPELWNKRRW